MMNMPKTVNEITPQFLTASLKRAKKIDQAKVVSFSLDKAIATGFFGIVSRLHLKYDLNEGNIPESLIVKVPCENAAMEDYGKSVGYYNAEYGFYDDIAPHGTIPAPECYYNYWSPSTAMIIMEDLVLMRPGKQVNGATLTELIAIIDQLAKFHATWWNSPKLESYAWLQDGILGNSIAIYQEVYKDVFPAFLQKAGVLLSEEQKCIASQWFESSVANTVYRPLQQNPQTIAHGDARLDNIFFANTEISLSATFIDFHLMVKMPGVIDVSYLLSQSATAEVRRSHEQALLKRYYNNLIALGIKDYTWDDCWDGYRRGIFRYLFTAVIATCKAYNEQTTTLARVFTERSFVAASDLKIGDYFAGR